MDICPRCGKKGTGGLLCVACAQLEEGMVMGREVQLTICAVCKRFFFKNRWATLPEQAALARAVRLNAPESLSVIENGTLPEIYGPGQIQEFSLTAKSGQEQFMLPARLVSTLCPSCGKRHSRYFEGVLQVRRARPEIIAFIRNEVEKQRDKGIFISKETVKGDAVDFQLTSQRYLQALGKKLIRQFGGKMSSHGQLFTRDHLTSKDLYRVNVSYTVPRYSVGAIVETDQGPMRVTHMGNARGVNLHSGKPGKVPSEGMLLTIHKSHVLTIKPRVMVLHPETFQAAPVANAILPKLVEGEKVKVVLTMHAVYIV